MPFFFVHAPTWQAHRDAADGTVTGRGPAPQPQAATTPTASRGECSGDYGESGMFWASARPPNP